MPFERDTWRAQTQQIINAWACDPATALARGRASTFYSFLLGTPMPPIVAAYAIDPSGVIHTLIDAAGAVASQLITNLGAQCYSDTNVIAVAVAEAQRPEFAPAYRKMANVLDIITLAEQELAQANQPTALAQLRAELRQGEREVFRDAGIHIEQSGGVNLGAGNSIGTIGTIIGANNTFGGFQLPSGAPNGLGMAREHRQGLVAAHTNRLRILETQMARLGYNTPPEVLTEIEAIRAQLAQLQRDQD